MGKYLLNDKVFVYQGPMLYEARIIKSYDPTTQKIQEVKLVQPSNKKLPKQMADQETYLVHYLGWNSKWDEWVMLERMMAINNDSITLKQGLEESSAPKKKSIVKEETAGSSPTATTPRPTKKPRMDTDLMYNQYKGFTSDEIKILVPDEIKMKLVDDWENITKDHKLVELPANKFTVAEILEEFAAYAMLIFDDEEKQLDIYLEIIESLKQYFNKALGTYLLYRYERVQYMDMLNLQNERQVGLCDLYSGIFLIRMLSIFPNIMTKSELNIATIRKIKDVLITFWKWFNNHIGEFLIDKYENQTPSVALLHT